MWFRVIDMVGHMLFNNSHVRGQHGLPISGYSSVGQTFNGYDPDMVQIPMDHIDHGLTTN